MQTVGFTLKEQVCFPLYALSRLIIQAYQPYLKPFGITYLQYLVLMVLNEREELSLKQMGELLFLDSGTLSPLLKKMIQKRLIVKKRNPNDERNIQICLSPNGKKLVHQIEFIPETMANDYAYLHGKLEEMKDISDNLIQEFKK